MKKHFYFKIILFFAAVIITATLINLITWSNVMKSITEGFCLLLVILILFSFESLRVYFLRLPKPHKMMAIVLFFCMVVSHLIIQPRATFPFISWSMFSSPAPKTQEVIVYEYVGIDQFGNQRVINPTRLFKTLAHGRIARMLDERVEDILVGLETEKKGIPKHPVFVLQTPGVWASDEVNVPNTQLRKILSPLKKRAILKKADISLEEQQKQLNETLIAIGKMYNRKSPHNPIHAIEIRRGKVNLVNPSLSKKQWDIVWHIEFAKEK